MSVGLGLVEPRQVRRIPRADDPWGQQNEQELLAWAALVRGAGSYLEVGSCYGHGLRLMAPHLKPRAMMVSVDLCRGVQTLEGVDTGLYLKQTLRDLEGKGYLTEVIAGNSHDAHIEERARGFGPYDAVFIDGDHDYEGVKQDWETYGFMGKIVGFHDIFHRDHGVSQLWQELKAEGHTYCEIRARHSFWGIGVIFQERL